LPWIRWRQKVLPATGFFAGREDARRAALKQKGTNGPVPAVPEVLLLTKVKEKVSRFPKKTR